MHANKNSGSKGFSLIELMVVILIIALIVAIVLPSLGGAKNVAKRSDTESLFANISAAIGSYKTSNNRMPGRFTVREMASNDNMTRGMSMAQNVMLDLGAVRTSDTAPTDLTGWATAVGPMNTGQIWVKPDETAGTAYFAVPAKYYAAQDPASHVGEFGNTGPVPAGRAQVPDLVDAFGNPILIWMEDPATVETPQGAMVIGAAGAGTTAFARATYDPNAGPAKFYWATNAAFLKSTRLGKGGMDITSRDVEKGSFLGAALPGKVELNAMAAILGNPGFPAYPAGDIAAASDVMWPTASRGSYMLHSAGIDGTFVGRGTRKNHGATFAENGNLYYGSAFKTGTTAHLDAAGKTTTIDFAKEFDDILIGGS